LVVLLRYKKIGFYIFVLETQWGVGGNGNKRKVDILEYLIGKMDPYKVLGIERNAGEQDIKKAYRRLSFQYHPDRNPSEDAKPKMVEINNAYERNIEAPFGMTVHYED